MCAPARACTSSGATPFDTSSDQELIQALSTSDDSIDTLLTVPARLLTQDAVEALKVFQQCLRSVSAAAPALDSDTQCEWVGLFTVTYFSVSMIMWDGCSYAYFRLSDTHLQPFRCRFYGTSSTGPASTVLTFSVVLLKPIEPNRRHQGWYGNLTGIHAIDSQP